jgi:hypothetical protein
MQAQNELSQTTSGQLDPKLRRTNPIRNLSAPIMFDGRAVSFSSNASNSDETINAVKEILLTAYRTRTTKG